MPVEQLPDGHWLVSTQLPEDLNYFFVEIVRSEEAALRAAELAPDLLRERRRRDLELVAEQQ